MARPSWNNFFMTIAHAVATRATCDRKHVGCVIVKDKRIIATGYNGSIPGAPHCDDVGHDMVGGVEKDGKYEGGNCVRTVHAEANAIAQAARHGTSLIHADIYINTFPCWVCFKLIASVGISRIFFDDNYRADQRVLDAATHAGISLIGPKPATNPSEPV